METNPAPVDMVNLTLSYKVLAPSQVVGNGISEPSTESTTQGLRKMQFLTSQNFETNNGDSLFAGFICDLFRR